MSKIFWKSLLVSPAILGATLAVSSAANALESVKSSEILPNQAPKLEFTQIQAELPLNQEPTAKSEIAQAQLETDTRADATSDNPELLDKLENYSSEGQADNAQEQITSVNELHDVSPTSWAYEALRSLVERYGCIVGYPDRTYRGERALTRWEFAAGLNACLNAIERIIQEQGAVAREDLETLKRLMQEFEAELAALGARVDNLEGRVAFLEDHQFSTTTKLSGEVIFAVTDTFGEDDDTQTIFGDRVRLELNTSFTGDDRLVTRLSAGNLDNFDLDQDVGPFDGEIFGEFLNIPNPETTQTFNLKPFGDNDVAVDWLAYYKAITLGNFAINTYIAALGGIWSDIAPTNNPYFEDFDGGNGALSTFASKSPIYRIGGGAGLALNFSVGILANILGPTSITVGYLAGGANNPDEGAGLFNGDYAALGQINVNLFDFVSLGLTYVHGFHKDFSPIFGQGLTNTGNDAVGLDLTNGVVGTTVANFPGFVDLEFSETITNSYGGEVAFRLGDVASISGYFGYTSAIRIGEGSDEIWYYGAGIAFLDLGKEGNVLGIFGGVQPYLGDAGENDNPVHVEAFYKYQLTDNISLTPGVIWLNSPEQDSDNDDVFIGTLRTTFTF